MQKLVLPFFIFILVVVTGCATTEPQPTLKSGQAFISTNNHNREGPIASMYISRIDGKPVEDLTSVNLEPGKHKLRVTFGHGGVNAETRIRYVLQADHKYEIYALKTDGLDFKVNLVDVTNKEEKIVYTKVATGYNSPLNNPGVKGALFGGAVGAVIDQALTK